MLPQNSQTPDEETIKIKTLQNNIRNRKKKPNKKKRKGNKRKIIKKESVQPNFATITMSSWAENFTNAATWQLKQQIAYWKSKATALEYENKLLHDIIRKNYVSGSLPVNPCNVDNSDMNETVEEGISSDEDENDEDLEVSEEFIQFLMQNAKYKEDAKLERERLKALQNPEQNLIEKMEAMPTKSPEDKEVELRVLYGENWQRIGALETSILSQFIENCDQEKPEYWPNIPLNFNFS